NAINAIAQIESGRPDAAQEKVAGSILRYCHCEIRDPVSVHIARRRDGCSNSTQQKYWVLPGCGSDRVPGLRLPRCGIQEKGICTLAASAGSARGDEGHESVDHAVTIQVQRPDSDGIA